VPSRPLLRPVQDADDVDGVDRFEFEHGCRMSVFRKGGSSASCSSADLLQHIFESEERAPHALQPLYAHVADYHMVDYKVHPGLYSSVRRNRKA
jgi:hypothetical protein